MIEVELPDGTIAEFPEGTPPDVMKAAIQRRLGTPAPAAAAQPQQQAAPPPTTAQQIGRSAGLLARDALQGIGGTVGILTDPFTYSAGAATGGNNLGMRDSAAWLADRIGLPKPETGQERIVSNIQEAATGGAPLIKLGQIASRAEGPVRAAVGRVFADSPGIQLAGAATGAAASGTVRESGGGAGAQTTAALLGAIAPAGARAVASEATRRVIRGGEAGRQEMERNVRDFTTAGTNPTIGQASPGNGAKILEAGIRRAPGGVGVMGRQIDSQAEQIGARIEQVAGKLSPATGAERGGAAVIRGITGPGGFMQRFRAQSTQLYDDVQQLLPPNSAIPANASASTLARLATPIQGAAQTSSVLQNSRVAQLAEAFKNDMQANGGQMPYDSLKRLRTQVGELIDDSVLAPDSGARQLRQLYGAMSDDLTAAARATNDPKVIRAVNRANLYHKVGMGRVEALENVIAREGKGPEAVYSAMFSNSREGGTTLRRVMQSLNADQQKDLAAATLRRLGRATPGARGSSEELAEIFSPETFLTNWNRMSPQAKNALFDRFGSGYRGDLDKIAAATSRMREAAQSMPNASGTQPAAAQFAANAGLVGSAILLEPTAFALIAGGMTASNVAARTFTNPRVVRWMAQTTKAPTAALPSLMTQLGRMGETDEDAAALYEELSQTMSQGNTPPQQ